MGETSNRFDLLSWVVEDEREESRDLGISPGIRAQTQRDKSKGKKGAGRKEAQVTPVRRRVESSTEMETSSTEMETSSGDETETEVREKESRHGKRRMQDRTPVEDEERNIRRKLNEFSLGAAFKQVKQAMVKEVSKAVSSAQQGVKEPLKECLDAVMSAMEKMMSSLSDGVAQERIDRDSELLKMDDRVEKLEEKVKDIGNVVDSLTENRIRNRVKESAAEMEKKVGAAMNTVKILDMDLGIATSNKKEIVRDVIRIVRECSYTDDQRWLNSVLQRTRIVVLGRETQQRQVQGKSIHTVPILFCCQNRLDAVDLDTLLRRAEFHPTFHWPEEIVEFVSGVRSEVRKMGVSDQDSYIRIRPEERDGTIQIKAESKPKNGGRFVLKGVWKCPPANKHLWDGLHTLYTPKIVGIQ